MLEEHFDEFIAGDTTPEEAVDRIGRSMTLWLNADRGRIDKFVYEPAEELPGLPDLPKRTLTVRTENRHTAVIMQAAEALNAEWREQDRPYIFHVEIDDYPWTEWMKE